MDSFFSTFTTSPLAPTAALPSDPFQALEVLKPELAERIALAFCYADDVRTLSRCLSYGDRLAGRVEYFAVASATSSWLDGVAFTSVGGREGLESAETYAAVQELAWAYLDLLDARKAAARAPGKGV